MSASYDASAFATAASKTECAFCGLISAFAIRRETNSSWSLGSMTSSRCRFAATPRCFKPRFAIWTNRSCAGGDANSVLPLGVFGLDSASHGCCINSCSCSSLGFRMNDSNSASITS